MPAPASVNHSAVDAADSSTGPLADLETYLPVKQELRSADANPALEPVMLMTGTVPRYEAGPVESALATGSTTPAAEKFRDARETPAVPDTELQLAKQRLLSSGYAALADNRLTVPENNSAYYFFSTVLLMDPDDTGAQRGLVSVRERYQQLLADAVASGDAPRAHALGQGALRAGVATPAVADALARLVARGPEEKTVQTFNTAASVAGAAIKDPARYDRNLSRALVRNGVEAGEIRALQWVKTGAQVQETVLALIDHYSTTAAQDKLRVLHGHLQERASPLADLADAHLQWQRGAPEAAIRLLDAVRYPGNAELARLRLLGGLLQNSTDFAGAEVVYAQLVRLPEAGARDWLGLAVALDRQGKTDDARQTYQHLVDQQNLSASLASFATQRLHELALAERR